MIWNHATLAAVKSLSTRGALAPGMDSSSARADANDMLARAFTHEARDRFGADVHVADLELTWHVDETFRSARGVATWGPRKRPARLAGGPADERLVDLYGPPRSGCNVSLPPPGTHSEPFEPRVPPCPLTLHYRLAGWDDVDRVWIMRPEL